MRSMTGYGTGRAALGNSSLLVEARSVNHRFLDVRVRLPAELTEHAHAVESVVRAQLVRGRIDVSVRLEGSSALQMTLDKPRARAAIQALRELRDELAPNEPLPLTLLAAVPDLFGAAAGPSAQDAQRAVEAATTRACDALWAMRTQEGAALAAELRRLVHEARQEIGSIAQQLPSVVQNYRQKLRDRVASLLDGSNISLDPGRLEHEVALFADRADVTEEIARLSSHVEQLVGSLDGEPSSVGRKLDFLLQEMAREANTIGSKVADADVTLHVVELKAVLERMREQVQNVL